MHLHSSNLPLGHIPHLQVKVGEETLKQLGELYAEPANQVRTDANNATQLVAANVTNAALKGAVDSIEALEPVVAVRTAFTQQVGWGACA